MTTVAESATVENPHAGQGSVLLDIGGDVGALVVTMPMGMVGVEVEIRPASRSGLPSGQPTAHHGHVHHPHVAVVARAVDDACIPSLVFPEVVEGDYELYRKSTYDVQLTATVRGGEVTTADWPRP